MKTLFLTAMLLMGYSGFSQTESREDWINRVWATGDTVLLKSSYEASKAATLPGVARTALEERLILQQRQYEHEWDMELLRSFSQRYYYIRIR